MRFNISLSALSLVLCFSTGYTQLADTSVTRFRQAASDKRTTASPGITFTSYFQLLKGNFVKQALVPIQISKRDLFNFAGFAAATAGVMRLDKSINSFALKIHEDNSTLRTVSPMVTKFGGRYALFTMIGIGSWSYIFKNRKLKNTTLLATQSYLTSGIWVSAFKFVSGRERPSYIDPQTQMSRDVWHGMFFQFKKTSTGNKPDGAQFSSFPSGHAGAAFSIATVYAEMYKEKTWVPLLAYTSASLVGLSRITENKHWASDVLVSSALGYVCGRQIVRNFHKLERLNSITRKKKSLLTYNITFVNRTFVPELLYTFR